MVRNFHTIVLLCVLVFYACIKSTLTLVCFECTNNTCTDINSCKCSETIQVDTEKSYCILVRETLSAGVNIEIKHMPKGSTVFDKDNQHYIAVQEEIAYNQQTKNWLSLSKVIIYACETDKCNQDYLLKQLPNNGLSLMLPTTWLDQNLQRPSEKNTTLCRDCPVDTQSSDINQCNITECQGSCLIGAVFTQPDSGKFDYQSFCSDQSSIGPEPEAPNVGITAVYYLKDEKFKIFQVDIICNGEDCSGFDIFKDLSKNLQMNLQNIKPFLPNNHAEIFKSTPFAMFILILLQITIFY